MTGMLSTLKRLFAAAVVALALAQAAPTQAASGLSSLPVGSLAFDQAFGSTVGTILCRTSSGWSLVAPGTSGYALVSQGTGACPAYASVSGSGTVTSVSLSLPSALFTVSGSPITTSGTLSAVLASQTANTVFAAPSGAAGAPSFRALVAADYPAAADGCVRLSVASTTSLKMSPYGCNTLSIGGAPQTVPSAGVTLSSPSVSASTLYYVYASAASNAVSALTLSTTGHVTGSDGREYLSASGSANTAYRLVGMVFSNSSSQFVDSAASRGLLNYFNRRTVAAYSPVTGSTTSTSYTLIGNTIIYLAWSDETVSARIAGYASDNTASSAHFEVNYLDGSSAGYPSGDNNSVANGQSPLGAVAPPAALTEGLHTAAPYGYVSAGTGAWSGVQIIETRG